jgi:hypothetical protein
MISHREQLLRAFEPLSLFPGVVFPICNHAIRAFASVRTGKGPSLLDRRVHRSPVVLDDTHPPSLCVGEEGPRRRQSRDLTAPF